MAEEGGYSPMENIVHRNSDEEIKQLMTRFSVSEEDVQVAIQIVGAQREKVEKYLQHKGSSRLSNIW
jgi:hypothetical protein